MISIFVKKNLEFKGPTLFLFEHLSEPQTSNFMKKTENKTEIFGAFAPSYLITLVYYFMYLAKWKKSAKM